MAADISLSESLGGLRVTNPDDDMGVSPSPPVDREQQSAAAPIPPSITSPRSIETATASRDRGEYLVKFDHEHTSSDTLGLGFNPDNYRLQDSVDSPVTHYNQQFTSPQQLDEFQRTGSHRLAQRSSEPLNYQAQHMQPPTPPSGYGSGSRHASASNASSRPASGMYMQQNSSWSSSNSRRYRDEAALLDGTGIDLARSGSRSGRSVMAGMVPSRDGSQRYRSAPQQMNDGNAPLPPRSNSRRLRAPTNGSSSGGYDVPASGLYPVISAGSTTTEEWRDRGAAVGTKQEVDASGQAHTRTVKKGVKDFNFGRTLGEGSYSTVLAATDRQNLKEYAIKVLDKRHIIKEKKVKYVNIERDTLNRLTEHPGIVRLYYTFQDERSLYFVLDLATGGELLGVLKKVGSFDIECTKFYSAQMLDSIAYMHSRGVIHRDLKPENVLLDRDMHTKITDFGTAKILPNPRTGSDAIPGDPTDGQESERAVSFVGTAEYVSPELLRDKNACKASDLWAFGCIVYQLLAGRPPFKAANEYLTFQKILALEYTFPDGFPAVARDLVERLLVLDPGSRLPVEHIKNHQFFEGVQWGKSLWRQKAPRLKPYVPPAAEPIKLNGSSTPSYPYPAPGLATSPTPHGAAPPSRPQLRGVTALPPPSQLDIDWSPVLSNNERIVKLGNLIVHTGSHPTSPNGKAPETTATSEKTKFSRFFSSNNSKKRERLVLVTSSARLVIAAAGGNEKKTKMEVNFQAPGTTWKSYVDAKGLTAWQLDTRDKHFSFEDPRATTSDPAGSRFSTQEWLDSLEQARETALAQSSAASYSGESFLNPMESVVSSPSNSLGGDAVMPMAGPSTIERHHNMRHTLRKGSGDDESPKGRKRFSKRHSKSGLAAVF